MKRILSWALVVSMLASMMPTNLAWAEDVSAPETVVEQTYDDSEGQEDEEVVFEEPEEEPTAEPIEEPTEEPTAEPTEEPTAEPTEEPTDEPTEVPTAEPTTEPTAEPTPEAAEEPIVEETPDLSKEKIEAIRVYIQWDDHDDELGLRPEQVDVKLCGSDGNVYTVTLSEDTEHEERNWAHSFSNLPKYHDGEEIEYVVETDDLNQYETDIEEYAVIFTCKAKPTAKPTEVASEQTTPEPIVTAEPEATVEPEATIEPEATEEPEATVEPETTVEPEATEEPAIEVSAVTNLVWERYELTEDGTHLVTLSWNFEAQEGLDCTFTVERAEEDGEFAVIAEGLTETRYTDSTAVLCDINEEEPEMKVYTYRVSAVCGEAMGEAAVLVCNEENMPYPVATLEDMPQITSFAFRENQHESLNDRRLEIVLSSYKNGTTLTIERSEADKDDYQVIAENLEISDSYVYYTDENCLFDLNGDMPQMLNYKYRVKAVCDGMESDYATLDASKTISEERSKISAGALLHRTEDGVCTWNSISVSCTDESSTKGYICDYYFYREAGCGSKWNVVRYHIEGLTPGETYEVYGIGSSSNAYYPGGNTVIVHLVPNKPEELDFNENANNNSRCLRIGYASTFSRNVTYTIERSEADKDDYRVIAENVATSGGNTFYTDENSLFDLSGDMPRILNYKYRVKIVCDGVEGDYATLDTSKKISDKTREISADAGIVTKGEVSTWSRITVDYATNGGGRSGCTYSFYREAGSGSEWKAVNSDEIKGLTPGATYEVYGIGYTYDGENNVYYPGGNTVTVHLVPSKPSISCSENVTDNSRKLSIYCDNGSSFGKNVTYTIERSEADKDDYQVIAENVAVNNNSSYTYYTDENCLFDLSGDMPRMLNYKYRAKVVCDGVESDYATLDGKKISDKTREITADADIVTKGEVSTWSRITVWYATNGGGRSSCDYSFYRKAGSGGEWKAVGSYEIKGLTPGATYEIYGIGYTYDGENNVYYTGGNTATVYVGPRKPSNVRFETDDNGKLRIRWEYSSNNSYYESSDFTAALERAENDGTFTAIAETSDYNSYYLEENDPIFDLSGETPKLKNYRYRIRIRSLSVESVSDELTLGNGKETEWKNAVLYSNYDDSAKQWTGMTATGDDGNGEVFGLVHKVGTSDWQQFYLSNSGNDKELTGLEWGAAYEMYAATFKDGNMSEVGKVWSGTYGPNQRRIGAYQRTSNNKLTNDAYTWDVGTRYGSSKAEKFYIFRSENGGEYQLIDTVDNGSYEDKNLEFGYTYSYVVQVSENGVYSAYSKPASVTLALPEGLAPKNFTWYWSKDTGNHLVWEMEDYNIHPTYTVERKASGEDDYQVIATGVTGRTYDDTSAQANTEYSYRVQGIFKGAKTGCGEISGIAPAIQEALDVPDYLTANAAQSHYYDGIKWEGATVDWDTVTGASKYELRWRKADAAEWDSLLTTNTRTSIGSIEFGQDYEFQVRALDESGNYYGDWSKVVRTKITVAAVDYINLKSQTDTMVLLGWQKMDGIDKCLVYRQVGDGQRTLLATLSGDASGYVDANLAPGYYTYWVTRVLNGVESELSEPLRVKIGNIPDRDIRISDLVWGYRSNGKGIWLDYPDIIDDEIDYHNVHYEIYDISGKEVQRGQVNDDTINGRHRTTYITVKQSGTYSLKVTTEQEYYDENGDYAGSQRAESNTIWFTISDYKPLNVEKPQAKLYDDNRGFVIYKPSISGGSGNYSVNYYLYDSKITMRSAIPYNGNILYMDCPTNGAFITNIIVTDNVTGESKLVSTDWFNITGFEPLSAETRGGELSPDRKGFIIHKPTVSGGSGNYSIVCYLYDSSITLRGTYPYDGDTFTMICPEDGPFTANLIITDNETNESVMVNSGWFNITGYCVPLKAEKPAVAVTNNGCGFNINKPVITGGSGNYTVTYYLYDSSITLRASYPYDGDVFYMNCPENGMFVSNIIVADRVTGEAVLVTTDWVSITGYGAPLKAMKPAAELYPNRKGFIIDRPQITGGSGDYTITYYLYDSTITLRGACPYNGEKFYMNCPENGPFVANIIVQDNVTGEAVLVTTDWFGISGYYEPLKAEKPEARVYDNGKGFTIKKPVITGGSGDYSVTYYLYDSSITLRGGYPDNSEEHNMDCPENGPFVSNVIVVDNVTGEAVLVTTDWFNITGH